MSNSNYTTVWSVVVRSVGIRGHPYRPLAATAADHSRSCIPGRCDSMRELEEREQTVGGADADLFESLPGSLFSLAATHSAVRTPVMGKF